MEIKLKSLKLENFKGVRSFSFEINGQNAEIFGTNASGKTTIVDAFIWLLFNKDSEGRSDFNIKTLSDNGEPIHEVDHSVEAILLIDDAPISIKKVYREKWVKKRGEAEREFSGHETTYFYNEVPLSQKEYKERIDTLCDESLFKLITNPFAFNLMPWKDRRELLFKMAGDISNEKIAERKPEYVQLLNDLSGKTFDEYKKMVAIKKKKIKQELDMVPARIDEIRRGLPDKVDEEIIQKRIAHLRNELQKVEDIIADTYKGVESLNDQKISLSNRISKLKMQSQDVVNAITRKLRNEIDQKRQLQESASNNVKSIKRVIETLSGELFNVKSTIQNYRDEAARLEKHIDELREKWISANGEELQINEHEFVCPTCKRELDPFDRDEKKNRLLENFNNDKLSRVSEISNSGKKHKERLSTVIDLIQKLTTQSEDLQLDIERKKAELADAEKEFAAIEPAREVSHDEISIELSQNDDYTQINSQIKELEAELSRLDLDNQQPDNTELKEKKREFSSEIDNLNKVLGLTEVREKGLQRLSQIEKEALLLGDELAGYEKKEYLIEQFTREIITQTEQIINGMFTMANFRMYRQQINGGYEEVCDTMYNGVPWSDLNTAARIQVGIDIINTLSKHFNVYAPIWIDGRESVVSLTPTPSQCISLTVSEKDKSIRIEAYENIQAIFENQ